MKAKRVRARGSRDRVKDAKWSKKAPTRENDPFNVDRSVHRLLEQSEGSGAKGEGG